MSFLRHLSLLLSVKVLSDTCTGHTLSNIITSRSFILLLSEWWRVSLLFLFCICSSLLPVLFVCFIVHFLICPLCCLVYYVKYFPLFGGCLTVHLPHEMWNVNLMQHQYINKITPLHQVGISHYFIFLYLVNFLVSYSLEYDFSGSTTIFASTCDLKSGFLFLHNSWAAL